MGIGHFAVGIVLKKAEPRLNAGWLVFGAFLSDFLLGIFAWLGMEQYGVPPDYASRHYLTFTFPYSHGLLATVVWAALAASFAALISKREKERRARLALVMAVAVLSHFFLDALVHVPELPLAGADSYKVGLSLWDHLALELSLEVLMTVVAVAIYLKFTRAKSGIGRYGMLSFAVLMTAMMVGGQASTKIPPGSAALVVSWIIMPVVFGAIVFWLDRQRTALAR